MAEGVGGPYRKLFLHKVWLFKVVGTDFLALIVRNTITATPVRILMSYYIK